MDVKLGTSKLFWLRENPKALIYGKPGILFFSGVGTTRSSQAANESTLAAREGMGDDLVTT